MTITVTAPPATFSSKVTFDQLVGIRGPIPVLIYHPGKRQEAVEAVIQRVHAPITPECSTRLVDFVGGERRIMRVADWRMRLRS